MSIVDDLMSLLGLVKGNREGKIRQRLRCNELFGNRLASQIALLIEVRSNRLDRMLHHGWLKHLSCFTVLSFFKEFLAFLFDLL